MLLQLKAACGRPLGNGLLISCATTALASPSTVSAMLLSRRGFAHVNLHGHAPAVSLWPCSRNFMSLSAGALATAGSAQHCNKAVHADACAWHRVHESTSRPQSMSCTGGERCIPVDSPLKLAIPDKVVPQRVIIR